MSRPRLEIELDVFSGRPNPVWTLDREESEAVLARLRLGPSRPPHHTHLGYRGFLLRRLDRPGGARPWLRIGHGQIVILWARPRAFGDAGRVEELLIAQAKARSYGAMFKQVTIGGKQ